MKEKRKQLNKHNNSVLESGKYQFWIWFDNEILELELIKDFLQQQQKQKKA